VIKRYVASKDTTITNAFKSGFLQGRATGSNTGRADSLEVFVLYDNHPTASAATIEKSRILVDFPISTIAADRTNGDIPVSGNVNFYLYLGNVNHHETLPSNMVLEIAAVSQSWDEGHGKDLDNYKDPGIGSLGLGANWLNASSASAGPVSWTIQGGDFLTGSSDPVFSYTIVTGPEDVSIDVTPLVEHWLAETIDRNGLAVYVTGSQENQSSSSISYYTKKFSARNSEYFFNRPLLEAKWDDSKKDQRNTFLPSASNLSSNDNLNTVYFYNYVRGQLTNIPGTTDNLLYVRPYESASNGSELTTAVSSPITGGLVETGVYSASMAVQVSASTFYDRWYTTTSGSTAVHTGTVCVLSTHYPSNVATQNQYEVNVTNLKSRYSIDEEPRFRVYSRLRGWSPTIYNVAIQQPILNIVEDMYWQVRRLSDNCEVIPFGTGSLQETRVSYDISGSYFDLDMAMLEPHYTYQLEFAIKEGSQYVEHPNKFKFKVVNEY